MKTRLLLIRHGETAWNAEHVFRDSSTFRCRSGCRAVARLAERWPTSQSTRCIPGPVARVADRRTVRAHGLPVIPEPGCASGRSAFSKGNVDEIAGRYPVELEVA